MLHQYLTDQRENHQHASTPACQHAHALLEKNSSVAAKVSAPACARQTTLAKSSRRIGRRHSHQEDARHQPRVLRWKHVKVLLSIARCRTAALGGHLDECTRCGHRAPISY